MMTIPEIYRRSAAGELFTPDSMEFLAQYEKFLAHKPGGAGAVFGGAGIFEKVLGTSWPVRISGVVLAGAAVAGALWLGKRFRR